MTQAGLASQVTVKEALTKGSFDIKLSAIIMGFANFANKQFVKGTLFLLSEVVFFIAFVSQIIPAIGGLITLGTQTQGMTTKTIDGISIQVAVDGDNSMLMLIFGLASLIFVCYLPIFIGVT